MAHGWPSALEAHLQAISAAPITQLGAVATVESDSETVTFRSADGQVVTVHAHAGTVQLSRSARRKPMAWWLSKLGRDPYEHLLTVEIRDARHRIAFCMNVDPKQLDGLAVLDTKADVVSPEQGFALLAHLKLLGVSVARGNAQAFETLNVRGSVALFRSLKSVIRVPVKLMYFTPVLLAPMAAFWIADEPAGAYLTVAFVGLVCTLFLLLAIIVGLFVWVGPRSRRFPEAS